MSFSELDHWNTHLLIQDLKKQRADQVDSYVKLLEGKWPQAISNENNLHWMIPFPKDSKIPLELVADIILAWFNVYNRDNLLLEFRNRNLNAMDIYRLNIVLQLTELNAQCSRQKLTLDKIAEQELREYRDQ